MNPYAKPWAIVQDCPGADIGLRAIVDAEGFTVCSPSPMGGRGARLIRAAPDLLAALEGLLNMPEYDGTADTSRARLKAKQAARRAIKSAKG